MVVAADPGRLRRRSPRYGLVKVLVTGRDGQVAQSLNERRNGHPQLEFLFAARPETDLAIPGSIAKAIETARPEVVINAAAYTDVDRAEDEPELAWRVNADAAAEAALAASAIGARIIQLSTDYVFDGKKSDPYVETDPTNPQNVYGASKLAGEERVRSANSRHLILRTSWVVSPFGRNFVKTIIGAAASRDVLTVVDDQRGRPTSALDLAGALVGIVDRWHGGDDVGLGATYHVAGSGGASWFDLAVATMEECRRLGAPAAEIRPIGSSEWPTRASRPRNSVLDGSRFERTFGFALPNWRKSLPVLVKRILECK
jgi:dTDP-4-dehydrorhamnose reductase